MQPVMCRKGRYFGTAFGWGELGRGCKGWAVGLNGGLMAVEIGSVRVLLAVDANLSGRNSEMEIKRSGSQASGKGPAEWFTGAVRIDPLFQAPEPARVQGASVTFEPGARTAWHTHPLGQTLIVTAGCGRAQRWGARDRGDSAGRRGVVRAGREALARSRRDDGDDAYRHPGEARWKGGGVDGACERRAIPGMRTSLRSWGPASVVIELLLINGPCGVLY